MNQPDPARASTAPARAPVSTPRTAASLVLLAAADTLPPAQAAAWRLAGAQVHLCAADRAADALQAARTQAALLLLDGALAAALPAAVLESALTTPPPTVVLPAPATRALEPDERVRAQLGVDPQALDAPAGPRGASGAEVSGAKASG